MNRNSDKSSVTEKNRMRDEIDEQIREYLKQGGKIDVLTGNQRDPRNAIGSVWHGPEDISGIGQ